MHLLQKMGWRPGEGLGKEKNGSLQPLLLEVKLDKKGLVANDDVRKTSTVYVTVVIDNKKCLLPLTQNSQQAKRRKPLNVAQAKENLESKHPVSLLGELSAKRKWQMPKYDLVCEAGPHHNRQFLFTVIQLSSNKRERKSDHQFC